MGLFVISFNWMECKNNSDTWFLLAPSTLAVNFVSDLFLFFVFVFLLFVSIDCLDLVVLARL